MNILSVYDSSFDEYGKVLEGYDMSELVEKMQEIEMPAAGTAYEPCIESLETCAVFSEIRDREFGGMPTQFGMCWGYNTKLNCLEYHRNSEVNVGTGAFVLLVAKQTEIKDGVIDTDRVKAFMAPKGVPVEIYATTLHYAPCHVDDDDGFRVAIILPKGTNTDKPEYTPRCEEDTWMTARNKWLLAHPDSNEAKNGAHIGLRGMNIDIKED